jgi:hypothetical protein
MITHSARNHAVELEPDLRARVDLARAVEEETGYTPPYLPPSVLPAALDGRTGEVAALLNGVYRGGLEVDQAEVILVAKKGGGLRPVAVVEFPVRVLYRALTNQVEGSLAPLDRSYERRAALERQPSGSFGRVSRAASVSDPSDEPVEHVIAAAAVSVTAAVAAAAEDPEIAC